MPKLNITPFSIPKNQDISGFNTLQPEGIALEKAYLDFLEKLNAGVSLETGASPTTPEAFLRDGVIIGSHQNLNSKYFETAIFLSDANNWDTIQTDSEGQSSSLQLLKNKWTLHAPYAHIEPPSLILAINKLKELREFYQIALDECNAKPLLQQLANWVPEAMSALVQPSEPADRFKNTYRAHVEHAIQEVDHHLQYIGSAIYMRLKAVFQHADYSKYDVLQNLKTAINKLRIVFPDILSDLPAREMSALTDADLDCLHWEMYQLNETIANTCEWLIHARPLPAPKLAVQLQIHDTNRWVLPQDFVFDKNKMRSMAYKGPSVSSVMRYNAARAKFSDANAHKIAAFQALTAILQPLLSLNREDFASEVAQSWMTHLKPEVLALLETLATGFEKKQVHLSEPELLNAMSQFLRLPLLQGFGAHTFIIPEHRRALMSAKSVSLLEEVLSASAKEQTRYQEEFIQALMNPNRLTTTQAGSGLVFFLPDEVPLLKALNLAVVTCVDQHAEKKVAAFHLLVNVIQGREPYTTTLRVQIKDALFQLSPREFVANEGPLDQFLQCLVKTIPDAHHPYMALLREHADGHYRREWLQSHYSQLGKARVAIKNQLYSGQESNVQAAFEYYRACYSQEEYTQEIQELFTPWLHGYDGQVSDKKGLISASQERGLIEQYVRKDLAYIFSDEGKLHLLSYLQEVMALDSPLFSVVVAQVINEQARVVRSDHKSAVVYWPEEFSVPERAALMGFLDESNQQALDDASDQQGIERLQHCLDDPSCTPATISQWLDYVRGFFPEFPQKLGQDYLESEFDFKLASRQWSIAIAELLRLCLPEKNQQAYRLRWFQERVLNGSATLVEFAYYRQHSTGYNLGKLQADFGPQGAIEVCTSFHEQLPKIAPDLIAAFLSRYVHGVDLLAGTQYPQGLITAFRPLQTIEHQITRFKGQAEEFCSQAWLSNDVVELQCLLAEAQLPIHTPSDMFLFKIYFVDTVIENILAYLALPNLSPDDDAILQLQECVKYEKSQHLKPIRDILEQSAPIHRVASTVCDAVKRQGVQWTRAISVEDCDILLSGLSKNLREELIDILNHLPQQGMDRAAVCAKTVLMDLLQAKAIAPDKRPQFKRAIEESQQLISFNIHAAVKTHDHHWSAMLGEIFEITKEPEGMSATWEKEPIQFKQKTRDALFTDGIFESAPPPHPGVTHDVRRIYLNNNRMAWLKIKPNVGPNEVAGRALHLATFDPKINRASMFKMPAQYLLGEKQAFPVLISENVPGETPYSSGVSLTDHWQDTEIERSIHRDSFSRQMVMTLITRPHDEKPDNLLLTPLKDGTYAIAKIDLDQLFAKPIQQKQGQIEIGVCSALFCMGEMYTTISPELVAEMRSCDPSDMLRHWLLILKEEDKQLTRMFSNTEQQALFVADAEQPIITRMNLIKGLIPELFETLTQIKRVVTINPQITHLGLLEAIYPELGRYYRLKLKESRSPLRRFESLAEEKYEIVHAETNAHVYFKTTCTTKAALEGQGYDLTKEISVQVESPEVALETLNSICHKANRILDIRTQIMAGSFEEFNQLHLMSLQQEVIASIDWESCDLVQQGHVLTVMQGKYFLQLNFKGCKALTKDKLMPIIMACPQLQKLDLENCQLTLLYADIVDLARGCRQLTYLNLSGNQIQHMTNYTWLGSATPIKFPKLSQLKLNACELLETIHIHAPNLARLSATGAVKLTSVQTGSQILIHLNLDRELPYETLSQVAQYTGYLRDVILPKEKEFGPKTWVQHAYKKYPYLLMLNLSLLSDDYLKSLEAAFIQQVVNQRILTEPAKKIIFHATLTIILDLLGQLVNSNGTKSLAASRHAGKYAPEEKLGRHVKSDVAALIDQPQVILRAVLGLLPNEEKRLPETAYETSVLVTETFNRCLPTQVFEQVNVYVNPQHVQFFAKKPVGRAEWPKGQTLDVESNQNQERSYSHHQ